MSGRVLLDQEVVDDLIAAIGEDGAHSVIALFLEESRAYLATICAAIALGADAPARDRGRRAAHSLKSGAGQVGATAVAAAAAAVEQAAVDGAPDLTARVAALQQATIDTAAVLKELLNKP